MALADCICSAAVLLGLASCFEAILTKMDRKSPAPWFVLAAMLFAGAAAVRYLEG